VGQGRSSVALDPEKTGGVCSTFPAGTIPDIALTALPLSPVFPAAYSRIWWALGLCLAITFRAFQALQQRPSSRSASNK